MSTLDAASLRELAELVQQATAEDYPAPESWTRPLWWRAEFDHYVPMARYVIYSASQGASKLRAARNPKDVKANAERRKLASAPTKVARYLEQIPKYEARIAELSHALTHDLRLVKREDGAPYGWYTEAEADLQRATANLRHARKHLREWQALLPPAVHPKV